MPVRSITLLTGSWLAIAAYAEPPRFSSCQAPLAPVLAAPGATNPDVIRSANQSLMRDYEGAMQVHLQCLEQVRELKLEDDRKWVQPKGAIEITNELYQDAHDMAMRSLEQARAQYAQLNSAGQSPLQGAQPTAAGSCPTTLAHLDPQLPRYADSQLSMLRNAVLQTDLGQAMAQARAMGYTPAQVAQTAVQQAQIADQGLQQAGACVLGFASDPDRVFAQLQSGQYAFDSVSATSNCVRGYVLAYYQALGNREAAIGLVCLARSQ